MKVVFLELVLTAEGSALGQARIPSAAWGERAAAPVVNARAHDARAWLVAEVRSWMPRAR